MVPSGCLSFTVHSPGLWAGSGYNYILGTMYLLPGGPLPMSILSKLKSHRSVKIFLERGMFRFEAPSC